MPFIIADRVRESSTTVGTGSLALAGAVTGYQTFDAVLDTGDTTFYTAADQGGSNWEVGIGTFTAPSTLARTTILSSSNGGSIVNFGAGTKDVFISLPASRTNVEDQPNLIEVNSSSAALRITQTGTGNALLVEDSANPDATPFVVTADGNVGVGTTTPTERLSIVTASGAVYAATNNGTVNFLSGVSGGNLGLVGTTSNHPVVVFSNNSERMRIDNAGQVQVGAGTVGAPALSTLADTNTGIFFPAADTVAIVEGGVEALRVNSNAQTEFSLGTVSLPSITATGDTNTGIYFPAADTIAFVEGGTEALRINNIGQVLLGAGITGAPSLSTIADTNTGIFFPTANQIAFARGGAEALRINSSSQVVFSAGSVSLPSITVTADTNTGIFFPAADTIAFTEGGTEAARIDSSANLLVGTTTAVSRLTVNGDVSGTFFVNPTTVSANYTIPTNYNAMTAGPITVNSGITVTVPSGSTWTVT